MSREGVPKQLRYPVANREFSDALGFMPTEKGIRINFRRPLLGAAEYRKLVASKDPLPAAAACYKNWDAWRDPASRSRDPLELEDEWLVEVYAVPREYHRVCHDALLAEGAAVIHHWLAEPRSQFWLERPPRQRWRRKECLVSIDPLNGTVHVAEDD